MSTKLTTDMITRAKAVASDWDREYEYIGIRVQEQPFELGKLDHVSHRWDNGDDTGEELNGISTIDANKADLACIYYGNYIALIGGDSIEYGEDYGEIVIRDPVVIEILA